MAMFRKPIIGMVDLLSPNPHRGGLGDIASAGCSVVVVVIMLTVGKSTLAISYGAQIWTTHTRGHFRDETFFVLRISKARKSFIIVPFLPDFVRGRGSEILSYDFSVASRDPISTKMVNWDYFMGVLKIMISKILISRQNSTCL